VLAVVMPAERERRRLARAGPEEMENGAVAG